MNWTPRHKPSQRFTGLFLAFELVGLGFATLGVCAPSPLDPLFERLERENSEIHFAEYNRSSHEQNLRAARSLLFPSLNLNSSVSKSKALTVRASDYQTTVGSSGATAAEGLGLPTTFTRDTDGWIAQLSSSYYLFAHFAVDQAIENAKTEIESASYSVTNQRVSKRSHFAQAVMEWQWLSSLVPPLQEAMKAMESVKEYASQRSNILYSDGDRVELKEKETEIQYNWIKVSEGLSVVETALQDMLPSLTNSDLASLPPLAFEYVPPVEDKGLYKRLIDKSLSRKIQENNVKIADGNYKVTRWKRPWTPTIIWSGNISNYGGYDGKNSGNSWSTQILFTFNLFDGFYTDSRRTQAHISLKTAEEKRDFDTKKAYLSLKVNRMKAAVSKSEFQLKEVGAEKKKLQLRDVQKKFEAGLSTRMELSLASLAYVKAKLEALEALKNYQSATLAIAAGLNEWDQVKIYAKEN